MIRINSAYYYEIGAAIHPFIDLPFEAKLDYLYLKLLYHAADNLDNLLNFNMVHTSHTNAKDLLHHIELLLKKYNDSEDKERQFSLYDTIKSAQSFESVYKAELQISNIYAVTPKGGYSIDILTLSPKNLFPEDLLKFFPDTKYDIEQSA